MRHPIRLLVALLVASALPDLASAAPSLALDAALAAGVSALGPEGLAPRQGGGVALAGLSLALAAGLAWLAFRFALRRQVDGLIGAFSRWESGDLGARARIGRGLSPLGRLGTAFDRMASALQDRERMRDLAHSAEHRMAQVLASTADAVLEVGRDGRITYMNARARALAPRRPRQDLAREGADADPVGRPLAEVLPDIAAPAVAGRLREAIRAGAPAELEATLPGTGRRYAVRAFPSPDGVALYLHDVTARHEAETAVRAAKEEAEAARAEAERAVAAKSRFLAAASHDLRQPVQSLLLLGSLLAERVGAEGDGEAARIADAMGHSLESLSALVEGLLDVSRLEAGAVEPRVAEVALGPLVARLGLEYGLQARARGLEFRVVPVEATVRTDPVLVERVLRNLIENALRYTPRGRVLLGTRRAGDGALRVEVLDTGPGIPPDQRDVVFEEFHQMPAPRPSVRLGGAGEAGRGGGPALGLGLGLAIVRRLCRLLGHPVDLRSRPGAGSCFAVTLPVAARPAPAARTRAPSRPAERCAPRLGDRGLALLVEDDRAVRDGLRAALEAWGWEVDAAASADEALALARRRRPDAVLADHRLGGGPAGRTGLDVIRGVAALGGGAVPAILLTGDTDPLRGREARAAGAVLLLKPVSAGELRLALDAVAPRRAVLPAA
jgi:signal transduction histidine kinase/ActR/RegA family two-component response regulator